MILDSSAVIGILLREQGHRTLEQHIDAAESTAMGAPTLVETEMVLVGRLGQHGRAQLLDYVLDNEVGILPFAEQHWREAGSAFLRFGKGRHAAGLNFGDCMTYATARIAGRPLLCLGNDFAQTDIELA